MCIRDRGSAIALALARTGVGQLHLIDFDRVEPSNLNRQQYRICQLGMYKAQALKEEIGEINPYVQVQADCLRLNAENAAQVLSRDEIICEAFDGAQDKAMLVDTGFGIGDLKGLVESLTALPVFVVNTHNHGDHVQGNPQFGKVYIHSMDAPGLDKRCV